LVDVWVVVAVIGVATSIITPLVGRVSTQNELIRTQRQTIDTQDRALSALEIAGKLQDKLYRTLPPPPGGPTP
jgi:type II secretory pathway pseudopilin PulG